MKQVLSVSTGFFHPPFAARRIVDRVLTAVARIQLSHARSLNSIGGLDMSRFAALVLYYHREHLALDALEAFERFVQNGGGVLAIHSATASFKGQTRYFDILGGEFAGHGPVEPFTIEPALAEDPLFGGIGAFSVTDELYIHDLRPDMTVHFTATYAGEPQPIVWTRTVGRGRVCYVVPGHRTATMRQPQMQEILRRGVKWIIGD
ncbi:MAG: ThuA domain-containing protein [Ardenticatenaceae bacterium]|nr:ThuA domain-containing protein [Ardenticatenaceae bacterium]